MVDKLELFIGVASGVDTAVLFIVLGASGVLIAEDAIDLTGFRLALAADFALVAGFALAADLLVTFESVFIVLSASLFWVML